jgi:hypothetical protein
MAPNIESATTDALLATPRDRVFIDGDGLAFYLLGEDPEVVDQASTTHTPEPLRAAILAHLRAEPRFAKRLDGTAGATQSIDLDVALASVESNAALRGIATAPHVRNAVMSAPGVRCGRPVRRDHGGVYESIAQRTEYLLSKMKQARLEPTVRAQLTPSAHPLVSIHHCPRDPYVISLARAQDYAHTWKALIVTPPVALATVPTHNHCTLRSPSALLGWSGDRIQD